MRFGAFIYLRGDLYIETVVVTDVKGTYFEVLLRETKSNRIIAGYEQICVNKTLPKIKILVSDEFLVRSLRRENIQTLKFSKK